MFVQTSIKRRKKVYEKVQKFIQDHRSEILNIKSEKDVYNMFDQEKYISGGGQSGVSCVYSKQIGVPIVLKSFQADWLKNSVTFVSSMVVFQGISPHFLLSYDMLIGITRLSKSKAMQYRKQINTNLPKLMEAIQELPEEELIDNYFFKNSWKKNKVMTIWNKMRSPKIGLKPMLYDLTELYDKTVQDFDFSKLKKSQIHSLATQIAFAEATIRLLQIKQSDTKITNFMITRVDKNSAIEYIFRGKRYIVPMRGYSFRYIDWGQAYRSMERYRVYNTDPIEKFESVLCGVFEDITYIDPSLVNPEFYSCKTSEIINAALEQGIAFEEPPDGIKIVDYSNLDNLTPEKVESLWNGADFIFSQIMDEFCRRDSALCPDLDTLIVEERQKRLYSKPQFTEFRDIDDDFY